MCASSATPASEARPWSASRPGRRGHTSPSSDNCRYENLAHVGSEVKVFSEAPFLGRLLASNFESSCEKCHAPLPYRRPVGPEALPRLALSGHASGGITMSAGTCVAARPGSPRPTSRANLRLSMPRMRSGLQPVHRKHMEQEPSALFQDRPHSPRNRPRGSHGASKQVVRSTQTRRLGLEQTPPAWPCTVMLCQACPAVATA